MPAPCCECVKFKCIKLAYQSIKKGGSYPVVLNVANDILVDNFLNDKIKFLDIPNIIEEALAKHAFIDDIELEDISYLTEWTKQYIKDHIYD